jgi:hypothetical protein
MATSNKVFVSPGVYTSERDLSFVAQSVGVTTLGIVGETLKGPAFEPIFITDFGEFETYFGGTSAEKFVNTQIPKYEAAYIAKSYLQQSNQLFVTRVLGLQGYDAGPSWSLTTIANPNPSTIGVSGSTGDNFTVTFTATTASTSVTFGTSTIPSYIPTGATFTKFDGSTSTIIGEISNQAKDFLGLSDATFTGNSGSSVYVFGAVSTGAASITGSTGSTYYSNVYGTDSIVASSTYDYTDSNNDPWYYSLFNISSGNNYLGYSFFNKLTSASYTTNGSVITAVTGTISGSTTKFTGYTYSGYNNMVVATFRSRGISTYSSTNHGTSFEISATSGVQLVNSTSSGLTVNPYSDFQLSASTVDGDTFVFDASLISSDTNYISKVFGKSNFAKSRAEVPLFVQETFPNSLSYAYNKGYIRGINTSLVTTSKLESSVGVLTNQISNYLNQYQTPSSPWLVSELRGSVVYRLFKFITISDGDVANTEVKVSIQNISFTNGTFDVTIRDYFDTDTNPVYVEKYTNCSMDPTQNNYVGKKIGTSDGEFALTSKYVMLEINEEAPVDALPCGFEGYVQKTYSTSTNTPSQPVYKTKYDFPGEIIFNPPFGTATGDNTVRSSGDKLRTTFLGFSTQLGYDSDFLQYQGYNTPTNICTPDAIAWDYVTKGFHMDSGATSVRIGNSYLSSGQTAFEVGAASFRAEPTNSDDPYYRIQSRKFTLLVAGGFDGWDIYRESRTNSDTFALGQTGYRNGVNPDCDSRYPSATGWGMFRPITVGDGDIDYANTDYYAYLLGIRTFSNPEAVNINVFVTPGIDYVNNSNLVEDAIFMIEEERADSIYITTTPDYNMFLPSSTGGDYIYPTNAVDNLTETNIDSNYTATYYPWILVRDTVNNTQLYIPPTGEVCKNLALTDNIALPWFASAGYTRGLVNSVKARLKLTQADRDTLYQGRINPIATFSDVGTVVWGNKTLQIRESALDRINVRRLLLQARKLISAVAVRLLFEQNDEKVRQDFLDAVNPILDAIRRDRGLYDFRVTVSSSPEDLDRNQLVGKVYIKPTKALEFIDIEFLITPTGASFENI